MKHSEFKIVYNSVQNLHRPWSICMVDACTDIRAYFWRPILPCTVAPLHQFCYKKYKQYTYIVDKLIRDKIGSCFFIKTNNPGKGTPTPLICPSPSSSLTIYGAARVATTYVFVNFFEIKTTVGNNQGCQQNQIYTIFKWCVFDCFIHSWYC